MANAATLITAIATLLSAIVWPMLVAVILIFFRRGIVDSLARVPDLISRTEKAKLGWLELELKRVAAIPADAESGGAVSPEQIRSAAKIEVAAKDLRLADLRGQIERLCTEYEAIRAAMPPGARRTRAMDEVIAQMRTIGPAVSFMLEELKGAGSPGGRLAAIAIMQMEPSKADLEWLLERFSVEAPFLFFHAALVFEFLAHSLAGSRREEVIEFAAKALATVRAFDGEPDASTVGVLESIVHNPY